MCCLWERLVRSLSSYGLKQGISWTFFCFSLFNLILCLSVHEKHKQFRVDIPLPQPILRHFLLGFSPCLLLLLCFPNVSKNLIMTQDKINCLHNTKENWWALFESTLCQLMELLGFGFSLFLINSCLPVHKNHKHVQDFHPTTTTSFPGRHNNNNNNKEKSDKN